jgi:hypothetical protein
VPRESPHGGGLQECCDEQTGWLVQCYEPVSRVEGHGRPMDPVANAEVGLHLKLFCPQGIDQMLSYLSGVDAVTVN